MGTAHNNRPSPATLQSAKNSGLRGIVDTEMDYVEESALYKVDLRIN